MASNRETTRDALATLISTAMTGTGKPAQVVYNYRPADFGGQSPVVTVSSSGSDRPRLSAQGGRALYYLQIDWFVLYNDFASWTEDLSEDRLDLIESTLAGVLSDNQTTANWQAIDYDGRSIRADVVVGGVEYARESVTVMVKVFA